MPDAHIVIKRKFNGQMMFEVARDDGKYVTRRFTARAASEAADLLMRGFSKDQLPPERLQVLRWLPPVQVGKIEDKRRPWAVKTENGFIIRRFQLDFHAKWWHKAYMWRRQELLKAGAQPPLKWREVSSLLDELERGQG